MTPLNILQILEFLRISRFSYFMHFEKLLKRIMGVKEQAHMEDMSQGTVGNIRYCIIDTLVRYLIESLFNTV